MFKRNIHNELQLWRDSHNRKPLILRGARQVGKTTAVNIFSSQFDNYIYLNLEIKSDHDLFENNLEIDELTKAIFFHKNVILSPKNSTLLFIDEIQNSSSAVAMLRYFYESKPELFIIAAGSLLESLIDTHISFPVGRVTYHFMYPMTFFEYLNAAKAEQAYALCLELPCPEFAHEKLLKLFHQYVLIGGFPEAVQCYLDSGDILLVQKIYDDLMLSYSDDVEKYARNQTMSRVIRHAIAHVPFQAGSRIKFNGFGNSNYGSKEMAEALRTLEKAMLVKLIYPSTSTLLPAEFNHKKSPRLQFIDTGLINYIAKLQHHYFSITDLCTLYKGKIVEHIVGQELLSNTTLAKQSELKFWVREKPQSNAEVDFIISYKGHVIPIEVKSGKTGTLKSLHQFMDRCDHAYAIRIYAGFFKLETIETPAGKSFTLLNLPYYLVSNLHSYLIKYF